MRWTVSRRPSAGTIISLIALFVALGGTSYAAIALAPKNSVGSPQVINGSLQTVDLSKKARAALKGNRGPAGPAGAQGAQGAAGLTGAAGAAGPAGATGPAGSAGAVGATGPAGASGAAGATGPRGPSDVYQAADLSFVAWTTTYSTQRSLSLPAGNWLVTATGVANSNGGADEHVDCRMQLGGVTLDSAEDLILAPNFAAGERDTFSLQGAGTLAAAGTATLQCQSDGSGNVVDPSITAIQVETLH